MLESINIEPIFSQFFLKKLASKPANLGDLRYLDKELYKNLIHLKSYEGSLEDLCLNFSIDDEDPLTGKKMNVLLEPNGT